MSTIKYQANLEPVPAKLDNNLPLNELFYTIQGEGRWIGTPAVFIRLQYCNLGCSWCDTRYTWDSKRIDATTLILPEELVSRAKAMVPNFSSIAEKPHIVLTGGEPMLFQDKLIILIKLLKLAGFSYVEIETNATIRPSTSLLKEIDWWNCSPKLSNSMLSKSERIVPEAIEIFAGLDNADFKFVVKDGNDIAEIEETFGTMMPKNRIMLMAEGFDSSSQLRKLKEVILLCLEKGYRITPRLHIMLWENVRGK